MLANGVWRQQIWYSRSDQVVQRTFAPGKAANAGGVAASGLEMTQNSIRLNWTSEEVDGRLKEIMVGIHNQCKKIRNRFRRIRKLRKRS
jgi:glutamate dehydrogenase/leucine dehydrogenase